MAKVYDLNGNVVQEIDLPACFSVEYRPDLITKAVNVMRANRRQPYGAKKDAGHYVAWSFGPGRGMSRVPRLASGRAAMAPGTVKGRRAHPPKVEKVWERKINKKEMLLARLSALAATANEKIVRQRGHKFSVDELPVIIEDKFEELKKVKEIMDVLSKIGVAEDIERAKEGKHVRAGKGKMRGRKYKKPKSLLIVASNKENIEKAAGNLPGVDVVSPDEINVEYLAPGGHAGRLTIFTLNALQKIGDKYGSI
ncbi:MAG TPA: 50S ribosomal protein L4 [Thermoplasmatales archaeon]|nr:50S ribosomal protein L4 [Thermoplasmatales archaeon]